MQYIDSIAVILDDLKARYGVKQSKIAKDLGISPQALTDMKAGRRYFTPELAEKLYQANIKEPWVNWLVKAFTAIPSISERETGRGRKGSRSFASGASPRRARRLPLLCAPFQGKPESSPAYRNDIELPQWTEKFLLEADAPYILELDTDDYAGRLRAGDLLLVVQNVWPDKEIMVVAHDAGLRVVRNGSRDQHRMVNSIEWIALDSGFPVLNAVPVATVAGIIKAIL